MRHLLTRGAALAAAVVMLIAGCQKSPPAPEAAPAPKPETVELVKASERSRNFLAVSRHLELGGTLYGYMDVEGDAQKGAESLQEIWERVARRLPQLQPYAKQDFGGIVTQLGLTGVKAIGLSSVPDGSGYFRNRVFLYVPEKRQGLLAGLGGAPAPFQRLGWAPANTDLFAESEIDLPEIYQTLFKIVDQVGGHEVSGKLEQGLQDAGRSAAFSALKLIQNWKGRMVMIGRFDDDRALQLPGPQQVKIPAFSLLVAVDGVAPAVQATLDRNPALQVREKNHRRTYALAQRLPIAGLNPVIVIDGSTLVVATSPEYMDECLAGQGGLAANPMFQAALARVGDQGNGLSYVTPHFFARLRAVEKLNPNLPPEQAELWQTVLASVPQPDRPLVSVRSNLPDGVLINSYSNASLKKGVLMISVYNPVTVGLMAAMAIPAFQKVRVASQEKAVLNNLRQLSAAADQYYLENGVDSATYDDLVGPGKYIRQITPVDGENYRTLNFRQGKRLHVRVPSLNRNISYGP